MTTPTCFESSDAKPLVTNKRDFVRRYSLGEFGNASPTWNNPSEYYASEFYKRYPNNLLHIRNRIAGGLTWYDVEPWKLPHRWYTGCLQVGSSNLYLSAMCPTEKTVLQGEVQQSTAHLDLYYSTVAKPMRDALKEEAYQVSGLTALGLLKQHLNTRSYEWLMYLLEAYPDHVVEFSTFSVEWGTVPGYNTCYWETRKY
jgi:hypothetical protein